MSQNIYYSPLSASRSVNTGTPSKTIATIERVFGSLPVLLDQGCLYQLIAMEAADNTNQAWTELVEALRKYDSITVDAS